MLLKSLETGRLLIRALEPGDLPGFHSVWGDPEVIWWGADADRATTKARLRRLIVLGETLRWRTVLVPRSLRNRPSGLECLQRREIAARSRRYAVITVQNRDRDVTSSKICGIGLWTVGSRCGPKDRNVDAGLLLRE